MDFGDFLEFSSFPNFMPHMLSTSYSVSYFILLFGAPPMCNHADWLGAEAGRAVVNIVIGQNGPGMTDRYRLQASTEKMSPGVVVMAAVPRRTDLLTLA